MSERNVLVGTLRYWVSCEPMGGGFLQPSLYAGDVNVVTLGSFLNRPTAHEDVTAFKITSCHKNRQPPFFWRQVDMNVNF